MDFCHYNDKIIISNNNSPSSSSSSSTTTLYNSFKIENNDEDIIIDINDTIQLKNIQEEKCLIEYTENHFMNQINEDLEKIRIQKLHSNNNENLINDISHNFSSDTLDILNKFKQNYLINNNSPVISTYGSSYNGSRSNSRSNSQNNSRDNSPNNTRNNYSIHSECDENNNILKVNTKTINKKTKLKYKKLCYEDIERTLNRYYDNNIDDKYSSEIDILTTYMKGQKNLYIQSKYLVQRKLNCLMIPSLLLSAFITIIGPFIDCNYWSSGFVSGCNGVIALLISLINYLKLESSIEMYLQMANHYDNLETMLELTNSKIMFLRNEEEISRLVLTKIKEIENKMGEIKYSNNVLIPEEIKSQFPIICYINIFSFIKKTKIYKKNLIEKLRDVTNEIRFILYKWKESKKKSIGFHDDGDIKHDKIGGISDVEFENLEQKKENARIIYLYEIKNKIKDEIMEFRSTYGFIDDIFIKEIKAAEMNNKKWFFWLPCFFNKKHSIKKYLENANPVILKYYKTIFDDDF
jgi:hypothetical protein